MLIKDHVNRLLALQCAMQFRVYPDPPGSQSNTSFLLPNGENAATGVEWSVKDVMVGTVRSSEQLRFCLDKCGYYVPTRVLSERELQVRYIALHEDGVGDLPGIQRNGTVKGIYKVPRGRIPVPMRPRGDPDELYYYYAVEKWELLPVPISIIDSYRGKPGFTNRFLLEHCSGSYQLFSISSESQWRLMRALFEGLEFLAKSASDEFAEANGILGAYSFTLLDGCLIIRNERGSCLYSSFLQHMLSHPRASFREICNVLGFS